MTTNEMTMRQYHEAVLAIPNVPTAIADKARAEIEKLDNRNSQRQNKPSKTAIANAPIKQAIVELLTAKGAMVASAIGVALTESGTEVSTSKASALCGQLVKENLLAVTKIKIKGKGEVNQYTIVENGDTDAPTE